MTLASLPTAPAGIGRCGSIRLPASVGARRRSARSWTAAGTFALLPGTFALRPGARAARPGEPRALSTLRTRGLLAAQTASLRALGITSRRTVGNERLAGRRVIGIVPPRAGRRAIRVPSAARRPIWLPAMRGTIVARPALAVVTLDLVADRMSGALYRMNRGRSLAPGCSPATLALPGREAIAGAIRQNPHGVMRYVLDLVAVGPAGMIAPVPANVPRYPIVVDEVPVEVRRAEIVVAHEDVAVESRCAER